MNFEEIKKKDFCVNSSYPKIEKNEKNDKLAKKLIDIYAGSKGEITATFQYMYESYILSSNQKNNEIIDILNKISICEMKHIELLAKILKSMDIDPKFCKYIDNNYNICNFWSAGNIKYITNLNKFLEYNVKLEEIAIEEYKEAIKLNNSKNIDDILKAILEDEYAHLTIYYKLHEDYMKKMEFRSINEDNENVEDKEAKQVDDNTKDLVNVLNVSKTNKENKNNKNSYNKDNRNIKIPILDLSILTSKNDNDDISDG